MIGCKFTEVNSITQALFGTVIHKHLCKVMPDFSCPDHALGICLLSFKWNLIRLGSPAHEIVTRTVHKTLPRMVGVKGIGGGWMEDMGVWGGVGQGVVGV